MRNALKDLYLKTEVSMESIEHDDEKLNLEELR